MKKLMILQIKGNDLGGVWYFNKTISEALLNNNFEIEIVSIRKKQKNGAKLEINKKIKTTIINEVDKWEITRKSTILSSLKKFKIKDTYKIIKLYWKEHQKLNQDFQNLKDYINKVKPDYIIASHYQTLDGIPKDYLKRTIAIQHSSISEVLRLFDNTKKLKKYSKQIYKLVWLSKKSSEIAFEKGFKNNTYLYNPVRFKTNEKAMVLKNKKLIAITRIENYQKRIDLMLEIVNNVLENVPDWTFELYGTGEFTDYGKNILKNNPKMKYMGKTDDPMKVLLTASINLNTSSSEGFSLTILEANMCGIPTITFDFGESTEEEILNNETGCIIYKDNQKEYEEKLISLMKDKTLLQKLSNNSKKFSSNFTIDKVILNWIELFKNIDNDRKGKSV